MFKLSSVIVLGLVLILTGCNSEKEEREAKLKQIQAEKAKIQKTLDQVDYYCANGGKC